MCQAQTRTFGSPSSSAPSIQAAVAATLASASRRRRRDTLPSMPRRSPLAIAARSCVGLGQLLQLADRARVDELERQVADREPERRQVALDLGGRRAVPEGRERPRERRRGAGFAPLMVSIVRVAPLRVLMVRSLVTQ